LEIENWNIAISNQCFEVWLYYHLSSIKVIANSSNELKNILNRQTSGGYRINKYAVKIKDAIRNSELLDTNKSQYFPDVGVTKLYNLGKEIVELLSHENGTLKFE